MDPISMTVPDSIDAVEQLIDELAHDEENYENISLHPQKGELHPQRGARSTQRAARDSQRGGRLGAGAGRNRPQPR